MSNHIGSHVDLDKTHHYLPKTESQVILVGIGMQSPSGHPPEPPDSSVNWLKSLHKTGGAIWTRGRSTSTYLNSIGVMGSCPIGCPSLFINPKVNLGMSLKKRINELSRDGVKRLAVAAGNPLAATGDKLAVEQWLIALMESHDGAYIVQHPIDMIRLSLGWQEEVTVASLNRLQRSLFPQMTHNQINEWFKQRSRVHVDVSQWLLTLGSFDLVIGTRIHGVQAGLQAGVPSLCLTHDSRTEELCHQMAIPSIPIMNFSTKPKLSYIIDFLSSYDFDSFDETRCTLARDALNFLEDYGLKGSSHLIALASRR